MAKTKTVFFCKECGYESAKWLGQCPGCNAWNSFTEEPIVQAKTKKSIVFTATESKPLPLNKVSSDKEERTLIGIQEFDRVLGGGIVKGSLDRKSVV